VTSARTLHVSVWRGAAEGKLVGYEVPARPSQTVLDVVTFIQRRLDPTLSYRFACRVGMCGSCAMTVNGVARWTCRTHIDKVANLPVIRDLAVDMTEFFDKWARAKGQYQPPAQRAADFALVPPQTRERQAADAAIECIGCGVCYASCDVVAWNAEYLGPAALNRAWSLVNDVRDDGNDERLRAIAGDAGCHACHSHQACALRCPKQLDPTASIAGLKRATLRAALRGKL
jgi:fumarate reductase iron-sulfur subunit